MKYPLTNNKLNLYVTDLPYVSAAGSQPGSQRALSGATSQREKTILHPRVNVEHLRGNERWLNRKPSRWGWGSRSFLTSLYLWASFSGSVSRGDRSSFSAKSNTSMALGYGGLTSSSSSSSSSVPYSPPCRADGQEKEHNGVSPPKWRETYFLHFPLSSGHFISYQRLQCFLWIISNLTGFWTIN